MSTVFTFVAKPVTVQAMQYTGRNAIDIQQWAGWEEITEHLLGGLEIQTLEGTMTASKGDWIVKGLKGEFYPVKPDIMAMKYNQYAGETP